MPQFQEHWRTSHADAAGSIPGLRRYVQNHAVLNGGQTLLPYPGFDACSELDFDSLAAMDAGFASDTYRQEVVADETAFVDKSRFSLVVARREVIRPGAQDKGVKLITFYRTHPTSSTGALLHALRSTYGFRIGEAGGHRFEIFEPISEAHGSVRPVAAADCVAISWWDESGDAARFESSDAQWELSGLTFGAARLIATPISVVG